MRPKSGSPLGPLPDEAAAGCFALAAIRSTIAAGVVGLFQVVFQTSQWPDAQFLQIAVIGADRLLRADFIVGDARR